MSRPFAPGISLLLVALLLLGCAPKPPTVKPSPPASTAPVKPREAVAGKERHPPPVVAPQTGRDFDESLLRGKEFLLIASAPKTPIGGSDNDLGALADQADPAVLAARALVQTIAPKTTPESSLAPHWKEYLQVRLAKWAAGPWNWKQVRFALPKHPEEGGVLIDFIVEGTSGRGLGQIYLSETAGHKWLIEDLDLRTTEPSGPFSPEETSSGPLVR